MNAEKESNPQAVQKKKQAESVPLVLHETENSYAQGQNQVIQRKESSGESNNAFSRNAGIPAVHGSQPAFADGSGQMHKQLQASLEKTGDLNHPETQQKELEYKSTLGISELRNYHDIKSEASISKNSEVEENIIPETKNSTDITTSKVSNKTEKPEGKVTQLQADVSENLAEEVKEIEDKTPKTAVENAGFLELQGQIKTTAKSQQQHEHPGKASQDAQAAALSPSNERESKAQASQVHKMDAQEPGQFSAVAFKIQLQRKIAGMKLPKNEEQADDFENNNNIKEVNQQAMGDVKQEKNAASGSIATTTAAKPNTDAQPVRNVAKMPTPNHGKAPAIASVDKAMPSKREATNVEQPIQAQTGAIEEQMKANNVTDTMLANSNEPSFKGALDEKNKAKDQSQAATSQFRNNEAQQLGKTQNDAQAQATHQISGMHGARKGQLNQVHGNQSQTASKDTEKRKEIADKINGIYNVSKGEVDAILKGLDTAVAVKFETGSKAAKAAFEKHIEANMTAYKKKRYGDSWYSWKNLKRIKDAAVGLPQEVNAFFVSGKDIYVKTMDSYITEIANHVATQLNTAKRKIANGKKAVQDYVSTLSPSLRKLGQSAVKDIQAKFNALEQDVNSKKDALIDVLAKKYAENVSAIDDRISELKTQNSGFVNQALNALSGVFAFIIEVKNTLMNLLANVVEVVGAIIADPIGFFSNLIAGVGQGFSNFITNIWTHLKTGFFGWLTGSMKGITITMPEDIFSIKGIFSLSMQLLGVGWQGIRAIGATVVGEPLMKVLETSVEMVQIVRKDGVAGLWEYLKDQFADLKETVMDAIMDIIQNQVIQAGIKWILGLLSPVGAFVKAVMAIIDVVKFFIQRAAQIMELVNAFIDSVAAIASGKVGAVAKAIENALGKAVPVLIGLLASILGLSGLADKVLGVIRKIRQRITAGITKFWHFVKDKGKGLLNKVGSVVGKKDNKTKEEKRKEKPQDKRTPAEKQKDLDRGVREGTSYLKQNKRLKKEDIDDAFDNISTKHQLVELKLVVDKHEETGEDLVHVHGKVNPEKDGEKVKIDIEEKSFGKILVGKHQLGKGIANYESHHVPENKFMKRIKEFYGQTGKTLNDKEDFKDIGEKLLEREKYIETNFPGHGTNLSAILLHKNTHRESLDAVHSTNLQVDITKNIEKQAIKNKELVFMGYDDKTKNKRAQMREEHWDNFIKDVYFLLKQNHIDINKIVEENDNSFVIKSKGNNAGVLSDISSDIINHIQELFNKFAQTRGFDDELRFQKKAILKSINDTSETGYKSALKTSIETVTSALSKSDKDGDKKEHSNALAQLKIIATQIWENHIVKKIDL